MACQVEMINGCDLNEKESVGDSDTENEILALRQSLKEKLHGEAVNGTVNGDLNGASGSSSSSVINNIETYENGLGDDKQNSEAEQEVMSDSKRQTPRKSSKGKLKAKGKKETPSKSKKQSPIKKIDVTVEEESTKSENSWNSAESTVKDTEDDNTTIDVVGDNEEQAGVDDIEIELLKEDDDEEEFEVEKAEDGKEESTVFARLRNSMRFSISPRKQTVVSSSNVSSSSFSSDKSKEPVHYTFRGISGRRALHHSSYAFDSSEAEPTSFSQSLKRKAQSESPDAPQRKHFISSFSEHSPGWKFFSSPFSRLWTQSKKAGDVTVPNSTPLRKLHEDVDLEDSMAVNVDDSLDVTLHEDIEMGKETFGKDKVNNKDKNLVDESSAQKIWRCNVM